MRILTLFFLTLGALPCPAQSITEHLYGRRGSAEEYPQQLVELPDGGLLVAGYLSTPSSNGYFDAFVQKTDSSGQQMWLHTYGGPANDLALGVAPTTDGGFVFGGYTDSEGKGRADGFVKKAAPDGTVEWTTLLGSTGWDQVTRVRVTATGGYLVCGTAVYDRETNGQDVFWALLDAQGHILIQKNITSTYLDEAYDIEEGPDGNIVLLYRSNFFTSCVKFSPGGNELWKHVFDGSEPGIFRRLSIGRPDGQIYLAGVYQGTTFESNPVICLDASGDFLWKAPVSAYNVLNVHLEAGVDNHVRAIFKHTIPQQQNPTVNAARIIELDKYGNLFQDTLAPLPQYDQFADAALNASGRLTVLSQRYTLQYNQHDFALNTFQYAAGAYAPRWAESYGATAPNEVEFYLESCRSADGRAFFTTYLGYSSPTADGALWLLHTDTAGIVLHNTDLAQTTRVLSAPVRATPDGGCAILALRDGKHHLLKVDIDGQEQWRKTLDLPDPFNGVPAAFDVTPDGGYVLFSGSIQPRNGFQPALCRLNGQGETLWLKTLETDTESAYLENMAVLPGGGFVLQGGQFDPGTQDWNLWLVFTNSKGDVQREKLLAEDLYFSTWLHFGQFQRTSDGGFLLTGSYAQPTGPTQQNRNGVAMLKLDAQGNRQWDNHLQELTGKSDAFFTSVEEVPCRGFVLSVNTHNVEEIQPYATRNEDDLRILQWIDYSGQVQKFFYLNTFPGPEAQDTDFLPGYTYYEWGDKFNPNFPDIYLWRMPFAAEMDTVGMAKAALAITPNPSGNTMCLSFSSDYTGPFDVEIFDAAGRLADRFSDVKTSPEWIRHYRNPLPGGHYFIHIRAGDRRLTGHWVKQ